MANLTIRNIEESLKSGLRKTAAHHGRSVEEEARHILRHALLRKRSSAGLGSRISQRFSAVGGVDLPESPRSRPRQAPGQKPGKTK